MQENFRSLSQSGTTFVPLRPHPLAGLPVLFLLLVRDGCRYADRRIRPHPPHRLDLRRGRDRRRRPDRPLRRSSRARFVWGPAASSVPGAHLFGPLTMGRNNAVFSRAVLGEAAAAHQVRRRTNAPRDRRLQHLPRARHRPPRHDDSWETRIGSHNFLMANAHVAHDCASATSASSPTAPCSAAIACWKTTSTCPATRLASVRARRPAGAVERRVGHDEGHPAVHHSAAHQLHRRRQRGRHAPGRHPDAAHRRGAAGVSHALPPGHDRCRKRWRASRRNWVSSPEVAEMVAFIRASARGINLDNGRASDAA